MEAKETFAKANASDYNNYRVTKGASLECEPSSFLTSAIICQRIRKL